MRFTIITHVPHRLHGGQYSAYGPYVREMNIWMRFADSVEVVAPLRDGDAGNIDLEYTHPTIRFTRIPSFHLIGLRAKLHALLRFPILFATIYNAMRRADHIHLRCPGNIGLIGCLVQILFPFKPKTAKYAGNWDHRSSQPWSYRLQKWLLNNTFLTRKMKVLVYGEWPESSRNILPFFTATYREAEKKPVQPRALDGRLTMVFAGSLAVGKRADYAIRLASGLRDSGQLVSLEVYGDGRERQALEDLARGLGMQQSVTFWGNQDSATVRAALERAHFLVLPSRSEGWPKVVAEAMFWGCVPLATPVSCVPQMLDYGSRGILLSLDLDADAEKINTLLADATQYARMSSGSAQWSRQYTLDRFESEIKQLLL